MIINFICSNDSDEVHTMQTKSNNILWFNNTLYNKLWWVIIEELFESLLQIYQEGLEEKVRRSEFVFDRYWFITL